MARQIKRIPFGYDGQLPTGRSLKRLLPVALEQIQESYQEQGELIFLNFQEIIGAELSKMAKAYAFEGGLLYVKVANSTLYSLLSSHERGRILGEIRKRCKKHKIDNIVFRMG